MQSPDVKLDGKTVVITGCNTGIGKETVIDLAKRNAKIIMACRNQEKAEAAIEDIKKQTGSEDVHFMKLDLNSLDSVRSFAKEFLEKHSELHILINNAGVMMTPYAKTQDGFETQIGTNHFGHFLLTNLLLKRMIESGGGRIVTLSSSAHTSGTMNFDDLNSEKSYDSWKAYGQSKLANLLFTKELHKRLEGQPITTYAVHPGVVDTDLGRHFGRWFSVVRIFILPFVKTPTQGAQTTIHCAVTPGIEKDSGNYFADCHVKQSSAKSYNVDDAKKLWEVSEEATNCKFEI